MPLLVTCGKTWVAERFESLAEEWEFSSLFQSPTLYTILDVICQDALLMQLNVSASGTNHGREDQAANHSFAFANHRCVPAGYGYCAGPESLKILLISYGNDSVTGSWFYEVLE